MESSRSQDFVHALMVKLNRVSIAAILVLVAIYGLVAYRGTTPLTATTQGSSTSGATHLSTTSVTGCGGEGSSSGYWPDGGAAAWPPCTSRADYDCGSGSNDSWLAPVRGPR